MELLPFLDLLSTLVFALVGARIAADKGLDYGGIAFIAAVASVSGGTLRNVFLGLKPVWISDPWITVAVLSAVVITLVFRRVTRIGKTLLVMDTFGLAIATSCTPRGGLLACGNYFRSNYCSNRRPTS
jgi:uncharacterized membrane protein YeiH